MRNGMPITKNYGSGNPCGCPKATFAVAQKQPLRLHIYLFVFPAFGGQMGNRKGCRYTMPSRIKSCKCTTPTYFLASSTTNNWDML